VTTYQETVPLRYAGCTDSVADIGETGPCVLLKLESRWSYVFGDGNFKQDLEKKRTQLVALNCHRDVLISVTDQFTLPGFEASKVFLISENRPYFLAWQWHLLPCALLTGFFYEIWAERLSERKVLKITKTITGLSTETNIGLDQEMSPLPPASEMSPPPPYPETP